MTSTAYIIEDATVREIPPKPDVGSPDQERTCGRCARPFTGKASYVIGESVICPSCGPYFRDPAVCSRCGTSSTRVSRLFGAGDPICDSCRNKLTQATCGRCRKSRLPAYFGPDSRPLCADCVPGLEVNHNCPACGLVLPGSGEARCTSCYNLEATTVRATALSPLLHHAWVRSLWMGYPAWLHKQRPDKPALHKMLESHFPFFEMLDHAFASRADLTGPTLRGRLRPNVLRKYLLASSYTIETCGLVSASGSGMVESEEDTIAALLAKAKETPYGVMLADYARWLDKGERAIRTCRLYISAARIACSAICASGQKPSVEALAAYLLGAPGSAANLSVFRRYLSEMGHHH